MSWSVRRQRIVALQVIRLRLDKKGTMCIACVGRQLCPNTDVYPHLAICADYILPVQSDLFFPLWEAAAKINTNVRKLLPAAETHLIRPPRQRERPTQIAVPATKEEPKSLLEGSCHDRSTAICLPFRPSTLWQPSFLF